MLVDLGNFAPLKGMEFFLALGTELEQALCALAVVLHFVDFGWSLALVGRAPTKIFHGLDSLANRKTCNFIKNFSLDANRCHILFCH